MKQPIVKSHHFVVTFKCKASQKRKVLPIANWVREYSVAGYSVMWRACRQRS